MKVVYQSTPKSTRPTVDEGQTLPYAKAKRSGYRLRWYLLLTLVTAPLLLVFWVLSKPLWFISAPGIITTEPLPVRAPKAGQLSAIRVKEGDRVAEGQLLAVIGQPETQAMIDDIAKRREALDKVSNQEEQAILRQLQNKVKVAQAGLDKQQKLLRDMNQFMEQRLIPVSDTLATVRYYSEAELDLQQAKVELLNELQQQKIAQQTGPVARLKADYEMQLTRLYAQQSQLSLKSPLASQVTQVEVQQGEYIPADTTLMWLKGRQTAVIIAYLAPKYMDYVQIGQQASVIMPNGQRIKAHIEEPSELVSKLPKQLSGPFDGEQAVMKVVLTPSEALPNNIEGLPVNVSFEYLWLADLKRTLAQI
ncbi:HlyD family secretion protein [Shewanella sp. GXUN23E]|uniref:HlyD family secretion protein n=1 Tax=Shewanella sp. GXUN23E TaxID=3422498 RepID=UPI003D7CD7E8